MGLQWRGDGESLICGRLSDEVCEGNRSEEKEEAEREEASAISECLPTSAMNTSLANGCVAGDGAYACPSFGSCNDRRRWRCMGPSTSILSLWQSIVCEAEPVVS